MSERRREQVKKLRSISGKIAYHRIQRDLLDEKLRELEAERDKILAEMEAE